MIKSPENLNAIFQAMPLPCLVLKPAGDIFIIVGANDTFYELVQSKPEDLIGKTTREAFPQNPGQDEIGRAFLLESLHKVIRTREKNTVNLVRLDIPVRGSDEFVEKYWRPENIPVLGDTGEVEFLLHVVKDVTSQILAEKAGEKMELQQRHFFDNNPDGLYSLDTKGNFISANEGLAEFAEVSLPELLKMNFLPFCHPEDQEKTLHYFNKAIKGETTKFEAKFISSEGNHLVLLISLLPMRVNEKIEGVYGIAKDLTSMREAQQIIVDKKNFLETNASFISNLLDHNLEDSSLEEAFSRVGKTVDVDRMYYFNTHTHPESGEPSFSQQVEWSSEKASTKANIQDLQNLSAELIHQLGFTSRNEPFTAFPHKLPEGDLREHLIKQDIKSLLVLPIFLDDNLHGFIGFDDCTKERHWSEDEITFLQTLTDYFTTALEKRVAQKALKEREEALVQSEKKFRALVQEGSDLLAILDEKGTYKFVSETSTRILAIPPEAFIGKSAFDFIHPEDIRDVQERLIAIEKGARGIIGPFRFQDNEKNWRWIESTATNLLHDSAVKGIVVNSRDITTVLNQAREIEHINERYRLAATATQDLMYDWDLVTDEVVRFHKTTSFLGYTIREVEVRDFWRTHIHPSELDNLREHLETVLKDSERTFINTKYRMLRADGTYAHFIDRAYIIRDSKGKGIRMVGATSDVSDITAKTEALENANKRFKMATKATNELIWDWDIPTGQVIRNKAVEKIYGYANEQDYSGRNFWFEKVHIEERERVRASISTAIEDPSRKKWQEEYRFLKANGEMAYVIDRAHILRDQTGKAIRMVGAVLDVTTSRQTLKKIEDQNKRLKEIAWEQSHVVRAPLARIQGLLHFVKKEDFEELSYEEIWEHIAASANELDEVIRRIVSKSEEIGIE